MAEQVPDLTPLALFGVFPCDLAAIQVQDRIFLREEWKDPIYWSRRQSAFILAVNCLHPCGTGFCASMGTGPKANPGYDLSLTELDDVFLVELGSEAGRLVMEGMPDPANQCLLAAGRSKKPGRCQYQDGTHPAPTAGVTRAIAQQPGCSSMG